VLNRLLNETFDRSEHGVMRLVKIRCTLVDVPQLTTMADVCLHTMRHCVTSSFFTVINFQLIRC